MFTEIGCRLLVFAAWVLSLLLFLPGQQTEQPPPPVLDISGNYSVVLDVQGEEHVGVVIVKKQSDDSYAMIWSYPSGRSIGHAVRDGNKLWVAWGKDSSLGICRYRIEVEKDQPKLIGELRTTEVLTFLRPLKQ